MFRNCVNPDDFLLKWRALSWRACFCILLFNISKFSFTFYFFWRRRRDVGRMSSGIFRICSMRISWCTLLQYPKIYALRAPLSYKERLWLVRIFCSTRSVVAGDVIYIERMELCVGYYRDVTDVHLDICHTTNDDKHCSKIRNNQIFRHTCIKIRNAAVILSRILIILYSLYDTIPMLCTYSRCR